MYIIISDFYLNKDLWRFQNLDSMSDFATFKSRRHTESNETIGTHLFLDEYIQYISHQSDLINDWILKDWIHIHEMFCLNVYYGLFLQPAL